MKTSGNPYRVLGGQTLIYGLGNVVPRILNYAVLTVYYTRRFAPSEYGVITELYAYVAVFLVILTLGMETGLFRFASKTGTSGVAFATALKAVSFVAVIFFFCAWIFSADIGRLIGYPNNPEYIVYVAGFLSLDAIGAIVFARLRIENKVRMFAAFKIFNVLITVAFVFLFLELLPRLNFFTQLHFYNSIYRFIGVGFVLIANLIASLVQILVMGRYLVKDWFRFDWLQLRDMLVYSIPLMIAGLAGMFNEAVDRVLLRHFLPPGKDPLFELGIYGANLRIAVLMTLFIQMFRYAAEPFFFGKSNEKDVKKLYANVFKFFSIIMFALFLFISGTLDIFKHFISGAYHEGLYIVPIVLAANVILGLLFNVNMWYKLTDKTIYGLIITGSGACITVFLNVVFIPLFGYYASAWIHLIANFFMLIATYLFGQRYYPIPYDLKSLFLYVVLVVFGFVLIQLLYSENAVFNVLIGLLITAAFVFVANKRESLLKIFFTHG